MSILMAYEQHARLRCSITYCDVSDCSSVRYAIELEPLKGLHRPPLWAQL